MSLAADDLASLRRKLEAAKTDFDAGRLGPAAQGYRAIVDERPDQPDALHMLGIIAWQMGRTELALELFDEALKAVPNFAQAWSNRAVMLRVLGRKDEALQSAKNAILCDPRLGDSWDTAGFLLGEQRDYAAAAEHHARAVALNPENARYRNNYAIVLSHLGRLEEAYRMVREAERLDPSFAPVPMTIGNIISEFGYPELALGYFRKSHSLDAGFEEALASVGRSLLLIGDMKEGWEQMEIRAYNKERFSSMPRWQGEKIRHLLLYAEQGQGDVIQFLRYVPLIRDHVETLTIQAPAPLRRLIGATVPYATIITLTDPMPGADAYALLMSLPHLCKTTLENIPASTPYLRIEESWRTAARARLAALPRPRVGIVWAGSPDYPNDHIRSMAVGHVEPIIAIGPAHFVSLQKGPSAGALTGIYDAGPWLADFTATAGVLMELDLVISVDTAVAHLAGALGRPVWTLLPFAPDWRWMLAREDSPWYPSMRLFRQTSPRNWPSAIASMLPELKKFLDGDDSVLRPARWTGKIPRIHPQAVPLPDQAVVMTGPGGASGIGGGGA